MHSYICIDVALFISRMECFGIREEQKIVNGREKYINKSIKIETSFAFIKQ